MYKLLTLKLCLLSLVILACSSSKTNKNGTSEPYHPDNKELYDSIVYLDSILFDGYNNCRLEIFEKYFSGNLEFYHDKGGLTTSKKELLVSLKNNICGKVKRLLVAGSIEVYPIPGYGAIQTGSHRFYNIKENSTSRPGKFIHTWHREKGEWKITRVISLH